MMRIPLIDLVCSGAVILGVVYIAIRIYFREKVNYLLRMMQLKTDE